MKSILFVHHISGIGGASFCLLSILKGLDRKLFTPIVLLKEDGPLVEELRKLSIEVRFFSQMSVLPYNQSMWKTSTIALYNKVRKSVPLFESILSQMTDIDVVYFNTIVLAAYLVSAKRCIKKTVIHIREHWELDEHVIQLRKIQSSITKYADAVIAINLYSASMVPQKKSTIVYDWIDMKKRYGEVSLSEFIGEDTNRLRVFLYTGGFSTIKGVKEVICSFTNCIKDENARLLILGTPYTLQHNWKARIKKCMHNSHIRRDYCEDVLKMLNNDNRIICKPALYNIGRILEESYCMLSYFTTPHANLALAESIILGTPCIASMTPESLEYSNNGSLASLFEFGNLNEFQNKLRNIDTIMPNLKKNIYTNKESVETMFSPSSNSAVLNNVLEIL